MEPVPEMVVTLFSFGFKHNPPEADTVVDVRFLPNPYYIPELSPGTGQDDDVAAYVLDNSLAGDFFSCLEPFLVFYIQGHAGTGRPEYRLAVGCTGGRHRSVAVVEYMKELLRKHGVAVETFHRDIDKV